MVSLSFSLFSIKESRRSSFKFLSRFRVIPANHSVEGKYLLESPLPDPGESRCQGDTLPGTPVDSSTECTWTVLFVKFPDRKTSWSPLYGSLGHNLPSPNNLDPNFERRTKHHVSRSSVSVPVS